MQPQEEYRPLLFCPWISWVQELTIDFILLYFTSDSGLEEESLSVISHHLPLSAPPSLSALSLHKSKTLH